MRRGGVWGRQPQKQKKNCAKEKEFSSFKRGQKNNHDGCHLQASVTALQVQGSRVKYHKTPSLSSIWWVSLTEHSYSHKTLLFTLIHSYSHKTLLFTLIHSYSHKTLLFTLIHSYSHKTLLFTLINSYSHKTNPKMGSKLEKWKMGFNC